MAKTILPNEIASGIRSFIFGGNAEFTIFQEPNIKHSYRVVKHDSAPLWQVYTKNVNGVEECQGYLTMTYGSPCFVVSRRDYLTCPETVITGLVRVLKYKNLPDVVHVIHHGRCSVCGRRLSDMESISVGIGPTCRKKIAV